MVTIQAFPVFGVVNPLFASMPLICIIVITALKDGYEDLKRHKEDNIVNNIPAYILNNWTNTNYPKYRISYFDRIKSKILKLYRKINQRIPSQFLIYFPDPDSYSYSDTNHKTKPIESEYDNNSDETISKKPSYHKPQNSQLKERKSLTSLSINLKKNNGWKEVPWKDIRVGDIIYLSANENVPADIVILSTSEEENECYIETKNLDGETTLKRRSGKKETKHIRDAQSAKNLKFVIKAENPIGNLYEFRSRMELSNKENNEFSHINSDDDQYNKLSIYDGQNIKENEEIFPNGNISIPLDITNMLLRGSVIRNTEWVIGAVIYTGNDTKVQLNSGNTPSKRSRIEILMNPQIVFNFLILFVISFVVAFINIKVLQSWRKKDSPFYIFHDEAAFKIFLRTFGSTMIMMQNVVPISLYISVEIAKTIQSWFIHEDIDLYYEETDSPCNTKTWNISDDLGQIEYIFSDKTGTLTQNKMDFMRCSIIGKVYGKGYTDVTRDMEGYTIEETKAIEEDMEQRMKETFFQYYKNPYIDPSTKFSFLDDEFIADLQDENSLQRKAIFFFFRHLAICHSVLSPKRRVTGDGYETNYLDYCAESPDEQALVSTARNLGFTFVHRTENSITINCLGKEETYEILHILEFNSVRKRMSVIVRTPKKEILLLCKGADTVIYERLQKNQDALCHITFSHLETFGSEGLRTLCIAYRFIPLKEYQKWSEAYHQAEISLEERDQLKDELASEIERNLVLLGATAIEDKLQEGVPECIGTLREAGIKIWVLTGDKLETAINIGYASNLLNRSMCLLAIRERPIQDLDRLDDPMNDVETQLRNAYRIIHKFGKPMKRSSTNELTKWINKACSFRKKSTDEIDYSKEREMKLKQKGHIPSISPNRHHSIMSNFSVATTKSYGNILMSQQVPEKGIGFALIIDGQSLYNILEHSELRRRFLETATRCQAVICCRVSPKQKAEVVHLVKDGLKVLCLSIGDGANDISMIQEANVGVGIAGQEGMQAAMSSDYAISQFRFLSKLLIVHGRWSYFRVANTVMNFFYKNIVWVFCLFWYQFSCGFSAQILFDYSCLMFFNFIFSSMPVMVMGVFDKDLKQGTLLRHPPLYETMGIAQKKFTWKRFFSYVIDAVYQSFVSFYIPYYVFSNTSFQNGLNMDLYYFGNITANIVITLVNICVGLNMKSINWISAVVLLLEIFSFNIYFYIYINLPFRRLYKEYWHLMIWDVKYWAVYILTIVIALYPRIFIKFWKTTFMPDDSDIYREIEKYHLLDEEEEEEEYMSEQDDEKTITQEMIQIPPKIMEEKEQEGEVEGEEKLKGSDSIKSKLKEKVKVPDHLIHMSSLSSQSSRKSRHRKQPSDGINLINNDLPEEEDDNNEGSNVDEDNKSSAMDSTTTPKAQKIIFDINGEAKTNNASYIEGIKTQQPFSSQYSRHSDGLNYVSPMTPIMKATPTPRIRKMQSAISIRSNRSRRYPANGRAMSVIFMDNNEEYVNTGFAFSYNDESEMISRNRSKLPLIKASSMSYLYDNQRKERHKHHLKTLSYASRRHSSTDFN